jgi:hypothetical protein
VIVLAVLHSHSNIEQRHVPDPQLLLDDLVLGWPEVLVHREDLPIEHVVEIRPNN